MTRADFMLTVTDHIPEPFLSIKATELYTLFKGPTLIHLPGRQRRPLFLSVLLHGNETTGLRAVQALLNNYAGRELPRALSLFIGNVDAARDGLRHLDGQPDYNRIWPGTALPLCPEQQMMRQIIDEMRRREVFASVDIHNNTGLNPHYACINRIEHRFLHLASLFSRTVVYFIRPLGVQSMAFAELCPAVTVECGKVGQTHGIDHASEFIDSCLHLSAIPEHPVASHDVDLFHTVATVKIAQHVDFGFGDSDSALRFADDLDHLNFRELAQDTPFASSATGDIHQLLVQDEAGNNATSEFFHFSDGAIRTRKKVVPSMLTLDRHIITQDCLCYLMERLPFDATLPA